ncbi:MAG: hypothetical protein KGN36_04970 [Acidobacteriota bacterium]|nr:hypothetical protein [Acidobacteriota bacterium]
METTNALALGATLGMLAGFTLSLSLLHPDAVLAGRPPQSTENQAPARAPRGHGVQLDKGKDARLVANIGVSVRNIWLRKFS